VPQLTILEGSTFCICDEIGDVTGETGGLFADDTRFLSRLRLTLNGKRPLLLSSGKVEYFSAAFFLRNPLAGGLGLGLGGFRLGLGGGLGLRDGLGLHGGVRRCGLGLGGGLGFR